MRFAILLFSVLLLVSCGTNRIHLVNKRSVKHQETTVEDKKETQLNSSDGTIDVDKAKESEKLEAVLILTETTTSELNQDKCLESNEVIRNNEQKRSPVSSSDGISTSKSDQSYPGHHQRSKLIYTLTTIFGILLVTFGIGLPVLVFVLSIGAYGGWSGIIIAAGIGAYLLITGIFVLKGRNNEKHRKIGNVLLLILACLLVGTFLALLIF